MPTPQNKTYTGAPGSTIYGGRVASSTLPAYLASRAINEWTTVPNSTLLGSGAEASDLPVNFGAKSGVVNAENGSAIDRRTSTVHQFGGGHADWAGNDKHRITLSVESPQWVLDRDHSAQAAITPVTNPPPDPSYYADGRPVSRHTYQGSHFIERDEKYLAVGGFPWPNANGNTATPVTFDMATGDWDPIGTWSPPTGAATQNGFYVKHPTTENIYFGEGGGYRFFMLNTATKVWTKIKDPIVGYFPGFECATIDPTRGGVLGSMFVITTRGDASLSNTYAALFDCITGNRTNIAINPSAAWTAFQALNTNHAGVHYNADQDCYYYYFGGSGQGGKIFKIIPNGTTTWDMVQMTMTGITVPDGVGVANGNILSRFGYLPQMKAVFALPSYNSPIYIARVA